MPKLTERLTDPACSGVYRVPVGTALEAAVSGSRLDLTRISLEGAYVKEDVLRRIAAALAFPPWFGGNWDALEDCLIDLSWREADGYVLLLRDFMPGDVLGILIDVLTSSAEYWAARGKPFIAVFVDPANALGLTELSGAT